MSIIYVLLNPVRAGIVNNPHNYKWSSIGEYFDSDEGCVTDNSFVESVFQTREIMEELLMEWSDKELPVRRTSFGNIIGGKKFEDRTMKKFDRRKEEKESFGMRKDDNNFELPDKIIEKFEEENKIKIEDVDTNRYGGKRLRSELLILLKDRAGLTYKEIMKYSLFKSLKHSSLGNLYKRAQERMNEK